MDFRLSSDQKSRIEKATSLKGKTISQWAIDHLMTQANNDIQEETATILSEEAFDDFMNILSQPISKEAQNLIDFKPVWEND